MKRSLASSNDDHPRSSKQARKNLSPSSSSSSSTTTTTSALTPNCPFLDTVRRNVLDFDVPHICKTTLSNQNVYACLVCGQFYRGRGAKSPAFIHALNESHFVFMKLDTGAAYCLPAGYEIHDSSLNDIKHELKPSFTRTMLTNMKTAHHIKKDTRGESLYCRKILCRKRSIFLYKMWCRKVFRSQRLYFMLELSTRIYGIKFYLFT